MSSIKDRIEARFRQARLARDEATKNVIGMLKNKILTELKSGKDVVEDEALWLATVQSYAKQLDKTIAELERAGERAADALADAKFELAFCQEFLPTKLDEAATEALVRRLASEHGITDAKDMGKLMGVLMKDHKDELDGQLARQVAQRVLGGG